LSDDEIAGLKYSNPEASSIGEVAFAAIVVVGV